MISQHDLLTFRVLEQVTQTQISNELQMRLEKLKQELDDVNGNDWQLTDIFMSSPNGLKKAYAQQLMGHRY